MSETLEFLEARVEALEKENAKLMEREKKATELLKEVLAALEKITKNRYFDNLTMIQGS